MKVLKYGKGSIMGKEVPYEKKKIHLPSWVIRVDQPESIREIAKADSKPQSHHIRNAIDGFIKKYAK